MWPWDDAPAPAPEQKAYCLRVLNVTVQGTHEPPEPEPELPAGVAPPRAWTIDERRAAAIGEIQLALKLGLIDRAQHDELILRLA